MFYAVMSDKNLELYCLSGHYVYFLA